MPNYSLVIFDFDGTLADSVPWFMTALDRTADRFNLKRVDPAEIESLRMLSSRDALKHLGVPMLKLPQMAIYVREIFAEAMHDIPMFAGAADMLAALRAAGVKLAVVSSNGEANVRHVLGPAAELIDHYACGSSIFGKAQKFAAVLRALRQSPARTLAVGDEIRDIDAARQAGLSAGAITFGYNARPALESHAPDHLFDDYEALKRAVLG